MIDFVDMISCDIFNSDADIKSKVINKTLNNLLPIIIDNELTEKQSLCIRYKYIYHKTQQEISELLKLSQPTVSRHITTGKAVLNKRLQYCYIAISNALTCWEREK